jgi:hypothetical protein
MLGTGPWDNWSQHTIDLLIAFGTFAAAAVAVGIAVVTSLLRRRRRPSVRLSHDAEADRKVETTGSGTPSMYVRLGISNEPGKHAAEDVQVFVVAVSGERVNYGPLGWTHIGEWVTRVGGKEWVPGTKQTLGPGIRRTVDLGSARSDGTPFTLAVNPPPASGAHELQRGVFDIVVAVSPRNADAQHFALTLTFEAPNPQGIRLTEPKPTKPPH